ncbi:hypothetical protein [Duganella sp. HH105]|uniref:DUF6985 domain-containing protein n=1 Tax=Duganella sp. HH105 TaxID=1781067 RepID=UPI0008FFFFED|nr:hypothetical protein [Duganella sp. HH105]
MTTLHDDVLGDLSYEYGWIRPYRVQFAGSMTDIQLVVPCDEGDSIEDAQRAAFTEFDTAKNLYAQQAETAIYHHYLSACAEYRERFGPDFADQMAPIIIEQRQIVPLITPTQLIIQQSFSTGDRVVGLLYMCSWEPELGLAVKFVNGSIDEVGTQDIIL